MTNHPRELPIPPEANSDKMAKELIRVWAAKGGQHVSIATGLWEDPAAWGILLVDLAKHVSNAYEQTKGKSHQSTLKRIKEGFEAEWANETDKPTGSLLE